MNLVRPGKHSLSNCMRGTNNQIVASQIKLLNRQQDGFEGKLTSSKWAAIGKCSPDTALRDINEMIARGVLRRASAGGRSTSYEIVGG